MTVFVVSGRVGADNNWDGVPQGDVPTFPLFSWTDLERLSASGVTIGAHSRTHADLAMLARDAVEREMTGCRDELRRRLGVDATLFAYPYGAVNGDVAGMARRHFAAAVTTRFDTLRPGTDRALLPRLDMYYFREPRAIEAWDSSRFGRRVQWVRFKRRVREAVT
jgi:peptidoglycan/xylan/chitin deacetylase (PgdA/CDA1 family)